MLKKVNIRSELFVSVQQRDIFTVFQDAGCTLILGMLLGTRKLPVETHPHQSGIGRLARNYPEDRFSNMYI